jgi:hypothetical protein
MKATDLHDPHEVEKEFMRVAVDMFRKQYNDNGPLVVEKILEMASIVICTMMTGPMGAPTLSDTSKIMSVLGALTLWNQHVTEKTESITNLAMKIISFMLRSNPGMVAEFSLTHKLVDLMNKMGKDDMFGNKNQKPPKDFWTV